MTATDELLGTRDCTRAYLLDDLTVRSDGEGRTVEAYAAIFNTRAEVKDADGQYHEVIAPGAFDKTIAERGTNFGVFYNHARTIWGTPDGNLSIPIGTPETVQADERGVFTATRYLDNPLADSILDGIKKGAIRSQSFSGAFIKSTRTRAKRGDLPTITRSEVKMREYGPTVFPIYDGAAIVGTRSASAFLDELGELDPDDIERLRSMLGLATPLEPARSPGTSTEAAASDEPVLDHSARRFQYTQLRARARKEGGPLS